MIASEPTGLFAPVNVTTDNNGRFTSIAINSSAGAPAAAYHITATGATSHFQMSKDSTSSRAP